MRVIASSLALSIAFFSRGAWAQPKTALVVERGAGAEGCPDADSLATRVAEIRGRAEERLATSYRVVFARRDNGFSAAIAAGSSDAGVRTLESTGSTCGALAHATAVTIALLFDSDVTEKATPEPSSPVPALRPVAAAVPLAHENPKPTRHATLAVGVGALAGVVRAAAPVWFGDVAMVTSRWRFGVGVLWVMPESTAFGPGSVRAQLLGGSGRVCFAPWQSEPWRWNVCSGALVAAITAEGQGYSRDERQTRAWLAFPLELALTGAHPPLGWEIGASALVPLRRQDFEVQGVGVAYRSTVVGAMLSVRLMGLLGW